MTALKVVLKAALLYCWYCFPNRALKAVMKCCWLLKLIMQSLRPIWLLSSPDLLGRRQKFAVTLERPFRGQCGNDLRRVAGASVRLSMAFATTAPENCRKGFVSSADGHVTNLVYGLNIWHRWGCFDRTTSRDEQLGHQNVNLRV